MIQVQQIDNTVDLDELRDEWNSLLENSPANSVFLTWEWVRTWWKYLAEGRNLCVLAMRDAGQLVAVAPLGIRRASLRRLIPFKSVDFLGSGTVGSDYLDLIVRHGWEQEVLSVLSDTLTNKRMLELGQLRSDAQAMQLAASLQRSGWRTEAAKAGVCPYIDLRGHDWTSYLATLSSEHRYNVRRKLNTLMKQFNVVFERVDDPLECGPALRMLIDLHHKRWSEHGVSDAFHTEGHLNFHDEFCMRALRRGWLRLYLLKLNGTPVSAIYALRYGPKFYFYQSGFDPAYSRHSVGVITMALSIQSAIQEGASEYDFLHGDEPYKFHWAKQTRDLARVRLFPPGRRGQCFQAVLNGGNRLRDLLRPVMAGVSSGATATMKG